MALTIQGWGSKKKKVTTTGGRELLAKRKKEREERDSKKTTRIKTIRGEKVTQWWDNKAKRWVNRRPARPSEAVGTTEQKTELKIEKAKKKNKDSSKSKQTSYVDPDAADKKDEKIFRSSSSGKVAKERHAAKEKSQNKDKLKSRAKELGLRDNSPAAKAGFSLKDRIALREKHNQWKADRKAGKLKIGNKNRKRGG